jgi:hypothetical protein
MRTLFICLFLSIGIVASAQRECGQLHYLEQQKSLDAGFASRLASIESFLLQQNTSVTSRTESGEEPVIRIPVVVHILYNNASQNVSDAQVRSQIEALNRDFRKLNSDTANIPARFKQYAADVRIEFVLAKADPKGRATTGINRKHTNVTEWKLDDKIKFAAQGGVDAWDSRYYLNIWVGYMRSTMGYASAPGTDATKDGVVISPNVFGTTNVSSPFHLGRTATHEVGHWLGLKHIWGDTYCGDDLVDDTPKQGSYTTGCPTAFRSSCNNGETGDMYMNYMDYTNDACMNLFTYGQKARMRSMFNAGGPRNTLLQSKGLNDPWLEEAPVDPRPVTVSDFTIYPNPATNNAVLNFDDSWIGKQFQLINASGVVLQTVTITNKQQNVVLNGYRSGLYFIQARNEDKIVKAKLMKL